MDVYRADVYLAGYQPAKVFSNELAVEFWGHVWGPEIVCAGHSISLVGNVSVRQWHIGRIQEVNGYPAQLLACAVRPNPTDGWRLRWGGGENELRETE